MKELKFNQGGQPIYLDDLKTLQETNDMLAAVVKSFMLSSEADVFFMPSVSVRVVGNYLFLDDGLLYAHGKLIKYTVEEDIFLSQSDSVYINIYHTEGDQRVLNNGTTAYCSESWSAVIKTTADQDATESYTVGSVADYINVLKTYIQHVVSQ